MSRLRRTISTAGVYLMAFAGGVTGAVMLGFLATWIVFKLSFRNDEFAGVADGLVLLMPLLMGVVIGFWGGICLVLYARYKLAHGSEISLPISAHTAT